MSIQPSDIINLAQRLQTDNQYHNEAHYRNVIGRWYYAVFSFVEAWLQDRFTTEWQNSEGNTHERIKYCCNHLQRHHKDLNFSKLGRLVRELHHRRVRADYYLQETITKNDMVETETRSQTIFELLDELKLKYSA